MRNKRGPPAFATTSHIAQIDTVAILGFASESLQTKGSCPGVVQVVSKKDGVTRVRDVVCSGNGKCGPRGCVCEGNWAGDACDYCKYGYTGQFCDHTVLQKVEEVNLCSLVMFEDLIDFDGEMLERRWSIQDYVYLSTRVFQSRHYGTRFISPEISLDSHTHIRVQAGVLLVDVPHHPDSGIIVRGSTKRPADPSRTRTTAERADAGERVLYTKHIAYATGVNVVGRGLGETSESMDLISRWDSKTLVVDMQIWSPDIRYNNDNGDHRFTITHFIVHSCYYPSQSGVQRTEDDLFL